MKKLLLRITLAALFLSGSVVAVMLARAATFRPDPVPGGEPFPFAFDELGAAQRLSGALQIVTVSQHDGEDDLPEAWLSLHEYLEQAFPRAHEALEWETVSEHSLLYRWSGTDGQLAPILLATHMDVVPADDGPVEAMRNGPFSGAVDGGYVWGRGAIDAKGSLLGILEAVEALVEVGFEPRRTILLAFSHDGETAEHGGALRIASLLQERGIRPSWVLGEGLYLMTGLVPGIRDPVGMVGVAEKAGMDVRLLARADRGSPSLPPLRTAAGVLSNALARLEEDSFPAEIRGPTLELLQTLGPHMDPGTRMLVANLWLLQGPLSNALTESPILNASLRTTLAPTSFTAGSDGEQLPSEASAEVHVQIAPWETPESVVEQIRSALSDLDVEVDVISDPVVAPSSGLDQASDSEGFQTIREAIHRSFPDVVAVVPAVTPRRTDSSSYATLSQGIYGFAPFPVNEETLPTIHGTGERVRVSAYLDVIRFYAELIRRGAQ